MTWPHPLRGTCVPECPSFGLCHCGCGQATRVARWTSRRDDCRKRHPRVYAANHSQRPCAVPPFHRTGVPVEQARMLARWLIQRYGVKGTAEMAGIPVGTLNNMAYSRRLRFVNPEHARALGRIVLEHRAARDPWRWTEEPDKRLPLPEESDGRRRHIAATEKAFYRARRAAVLAS